MRFSVVIVGVVIFACVNARVGKFYPEELKKNPKLKWSKISRHTRDLDDFGWDRQFQDEDVFSSSNEELLEPRGYNQRHRNHIIIGNSGQLEDQGFVIRSLAATEDRRIWADGRSKRRI